MVEILTQHSGALTIVGYWLFSAFVGGMPEPLAASPAVYGWLYKSLHILAGNLSNAIFPRKSSADLSN